MVKQRPTATGRLAPRSARFSKPESESSGEEEEASDSCSSNGSPPPCTHSRKSEPRQTAENGAAAAPKRTVRGRGSVARRMYADDYEDDQRNWPREQELSESGEKVVHEQKRTAKHPENRINYSRTEFNYGNFNDPGGSSPSKGMVDTNIVRKGRGNLGEIPRDAEYFAYRRGPAPVHKRLYDPKNPQSAMNAKESASAHTTQYSKNAKNDESTASDSSERRLLLGGFYEGRPVSTEDPIHQLKLNYKIICKAEEELAKQRAQRKVSTFRDTSMLRKQMESRLRLASLYVQIIEQDYGVALNHDLETRLWRNGFYSLVESLRAFLQSASGASLSDDMLTAWRDFFRQAEEIYLGLVCTLKSTAAKTAAGRPRYGDTAMWHRCLNFMGDLERYRILYLEGVPKSSPASKKWESAKVHYKEAAFLAPSNGLYYNQLAILHAYEEQYLGALYYYLRSLTVKAPFLNARDSLVLLFNAAQKASVSETSGRTLRNLFVRMHAVLFTKISVEQFPKLFGQFAEILKELLPSALSDANDANWTCWLEMAVVNVATLTLHSQSVSQRSTGAGPVVLEEDGVAEHLIALSLHILEAVVQKQISDLGRDSTSDLKIAAGLLYVEVMLTGLATMDEGWAPMLGNLKYGRLWSSLAILCNTLSTRVTFSADFTNPNQLLSSNILPEDWELRGFIPLKETHGRLTYHSKEDGKDWSRLERLVQQCLDGRGDARFSDILGDGTVGTGRARRLLEVAKFLTERLPFMHFDAETRKFSYDKTAVVGAVPGNAAQEISLPSDEEEEVLEYEDENMTVGRWGDEEEFGEDSDTVKELKSRRQELHGALTSQKRVFVSSALTDRVRASPVKMIPGKTVIVYDTNCWMGRFDEVKQVVESGKWTVSVPLVVIAELGGLKTDVSTIRGQSALTALKYLEQEFDPNLDPAKRKKWFKLQTSQGNFLPSLIVRTERWGSDEWNDADVKKNNDDVVLRCCLHFKKGGRSTQGTSEVVLVTDDVNLRLKARTIGVDVVDKVEE
ncbi:Smg-6, nonsense mediated mRNA decay factor [Borealophlyctis nickersoniae]|nr:Smg-6, nonsense mediated mRNA decay factor [Borealophlyctis nickersoniae]